MASMIALGRRDQETFDALVAELQEKHHAEVPFKLSRNTLEAAAESFFGFLSIPQQEKEALHFFMRPEDRQGIGYVRKSGAEDEVGRTDFKEYFHYHPKFKERFANHAAYTRKETQLFIQAADEIHTEAVAAMKAILEIMSVEFPQLYKDFFISSEDYIEYSAIRFLKYEPSGKGNFLARAHYDRGCTTLALAESAPGLRIGRDDDGLRAVEHKDNVALFMPAYQLPSLTDERFNPAWHDVVQASENVYKENAARWAIVFFADAASAIVPTKEASHTPIK